MNLDIKMMNVNNEDDRLLVAIKIAEAIKEFHDQKYYHGAIQPRNIMITPDGDIFLTGYGLESLRKYLSLTA